MKDTLRSSVIAVLITMSSVPLAARPDPGNETSLPRPSFGAGMGVTSLNAPDIAAFVGAVTGERVADFKAAAEFFGTLGIPVSEQWILKLEYAYLVGGYSVPGQLGQAEFTINVHMPTAVMHYILVEDSLYNFRVGCGIGYHVGMLTTRYGTLDDTFSGQGPGLKLDLEGNTALGEDLFARLGLDARWDFIGDLKNAAGDVPQTPPETPRPTLLFFGVGAKLGITWYF